jgi:hypothetical protein
MELVIVPFKDMDRPPTAPVSEDGSLEVADSNRVVLLVIGSFAENSRLVDEAVKALVQARGSSSKTKGAIRHRTIIVE